jgi:hypothetical protein
MPVDVFPDCYNIFQIGMRWIMKIEERIEYKKL